MRQVDTRDNLVGIFPGGLINRGKKKNLLKRFDSLCKLGSQSFSGVRQVVGKIWKEVFSRRTLARVTHYNIGVFWLAEIWEQQIDWVPEKDWATLERQLFANSHAKIVRGDAKNIADKYTKITIFIIWEAL